MIIIIVTSRYEQTYSRQTQALSCSKVYSRHSSKASSEINFVISLFLNYACINKYNTDRNGDKSVNPFSNIEKEAAAMNRSGYVKLEGAILHTVRLYSDHHNNNNRV